MNLKSTTTISSALDKQPITNTHPVDVLQEQLKTQYLVEGNLLNGHRDHKEQNWSANATGKHHPSSYWG